MEWDDLVTKAKTALTERQLVPEYQERFETELEEITKQGTNDYWVDQLKNASRWDVNPDGLVLPWLLDMTPVDPIKAGVKHNWSYQTDFPDIDLDFMPMARSTIKEHAGAAYTYVCSVGNWITYKPKSALLDVARALGSNVMLVQQLTTNLPDEFDDLTREDHKAFFETLKDPDPKIRADAHIEINRYQPFYDFEKANPDLVNIAFSLVGKIKAQGTHAGGVIIADRPIEDIVPMSLIHGNWTSQWTEGKKTQLSKFGLVKFDILGVKTIYYIWQAGNLIKKAHGITIDWTRMDPVAENPYMGFEILPDGTESPIPLNDQDSLEQCNQQKTDSVFQIETPIQKRIISDGKVKDFYDLVAYNALGRPGPMDCIPDFIRNRDINTSWADSEDKRIAQILKTTHGIICYQEQLQAMWQQLAKFTAPEAESARKIISKKWVEKLPQIEEKWKRGASRTIGEQATNAWWDKMVTFGRYAFNKSHAVAYSIITYRCLYLKAHYPAEWWAAVMTECQPYKLSTYMSAARLEGVKFGRLNVNSLSIEYSVREGKVVPGLLSVKGVGDNAAKRIVATPGPFTDIDDFVLKTGKDKKTIERLIKLGAFDDLHNNRQGLWVWYQYKYCTGTDISKIKRALEAQFAWPEEKINAERQRQTDEYRQLYPKKKVIPKKILNWKPKIELIRDQIIDVFAGYAPGELLKMEKEFLGYYWSSPLDMYITNENCTIEDAKIGGNLEAVIESVIERKARASGNRFYVVKVTDGIQTADITVWADIYNSADQRIFEQGVGVRVAVDFNEERRSFKIQNGTHLIPLIRKDSPEAVQFTNTVPDGDNSLW